jgi:hypothetical protein
VGELHMQVVTRMNLHLKKLGKLVEQHTQVVMLTNLRLKKPVKLVH